MEHLKDPQNILIFPIKGILHSVKGAQQHLTDRCCHTECIMYWQI